MIKVLIATILIGQAHIETGNIEAINHVNQYIRTRDAQILYMHSTPIHSQDDQIIDPKNLMIGDTIYAAFQAETSQYPLYIKILKSVDESFNIAQEKWIAQQKQLIIDPIILRLGNPNFWIREETTQEIKTNKTRYLRALIHGSVLCKDPEILDRISKILNHN